MKRLPLKTRLLIAFPGVSLHIIETSQKQAYSDPLRDHCEKRTGYSDLKHHYHTRRAEVWCEFTNQRLSGWYFASDIKRVSPITVMG
jgi:hypothetical protein